MSDWKLITPLHQHSILTSFNNTKNTHTESHRIFTSPPTSNSIFPHFTVEPLPSVASPFFLHQNLPNPLQKIQKISIGPDKTPHPLFFPLKQNSLFGDFFPHTGTPLKCLNGIRASMELFIKNFFLRWSPYFAYTCILYMQYQCPLTLPLSPDSRRHMNPVMSN